MIKKLILVAALTLVTLVQASAVLFSGKGTPAPPPPQPNPCVCSGPGGGGAGGLPLVIEGYWFWAFPTDGGSDGSGPPSIATVQTKAPVSNYIGWFAYVGTGNNDGHITNSGVATPSASDIAAWKAAGKFITMTIGGGASNPGSGTSIQLTTNSQEANMLADIKTAVSSFGFQGVDIDLEGGASQWDNTRLCLLFSDLKAFYGNSFIVDIDPAPFEIRGTSGAAIYGSLYTVCGSNIDLVSPQWYSQCGQTDNFFINSYIIPDLGTITSTVGVPSNKILIGAADNNGDCGAPGGASTYCTAYTNWVSAHPSLVPRGMKWYETASDEGGTPAYNYASTIKTCLGL